MKTYPLAIATSLLLAFSGGAVFAQGASGQEAAPGGDAQQAAPAPQQQDQAQAMPQPEPEPASAEQVQKCNTVAKKIMTSLKKEDFAAASSTFDENLKSMLSDDTLQEGWSSLKDEFGKPGAYSDATEGQRIQDYTVVLAPMEFENATVGAQVACDDQDQASSLRIGVIADDSQPADQQAPSPANNGS